MIHTIDLHFLDIPQTIAAYLVETPNGPVLVETGPFSTFEYLQKGVENFGYRIEDIKHVLLTHIHLDHAGAAWALAASGAKIYAHPFGQTHLHDPVRLLESARRIYQDDMDRLWGEMKGILPGQLVAMTHGDSLQVGGHEFIAWHTPGHAVHHIAWQYGKTVFAGDVAGVRIGAGPVVPPCPPPDINVEDWQMSIDLIRDLEPEKLYLTHYGGVENIEAHLAKLEERLLDWANWMKQYYNKNIPEEKITKKFQAYVREMLMKNGVDEEGLQQYENANPAWMSVAGLIRYWRKKIEKRSD